MTAMLGLPDELNGLLEQSIESTLSPEEKRRLNELLTDSEARRYYLTYMDLHGTLCWDAATFEPCSPAELHQGKRRPTEASQGAAPEARSPVLGFLGDLGQQGLDLLSRPGTPSMLVAAMAVGSLLTVLAMSIAPIFLESPSDGWPSLPAHHAYVAQVARTVDCRWDESKPTPYRGEFLSMGQELRLRSGLAELVFDSGARVILQGPATFEIDSENGGALPVGKLTANVPHQAIGFTIETPHADVVDLGTEFGVEVDEQGTAEVHVFVGAVQVETLPSAPKIPGTARNGPTRKKETFRAGEAVRILTDRAKKTPLVEKQIASDQRFVRRLAGIAPAPDPTTRLHGSYDGGYLPDSPAAPPGQSQWHTFLAPGMRILANISFGKNAPGFAHFIDRGEGRLQMFRVHPGVDWGHDPRCVEYEFFGRLKIGRRTVPRPGHDWAYQVFGFRDEDNRGKVVSLGWFFDLDGDGKADDPGLALIGYSAKCLVPVVQKNLADGQFHEYCVRKYLDGNEMKIQVFLDGKAQLDPPLIYDELEDDSEDAVGRGFGLFSSGAAFVDLIVDKVQYHSTGCAELPETR